MPPLGCSPSSGTAVILSILLRDASDSAAELRDSLTEARRALRIAEADAKGYLNVPRSIRLTSPVLEGDDPVADAFVQVPGDQPTLVYVLDADCAACDINYDFLRRLADAAGGRVHGVSLEDEPLRIREYSQSQRLNFPTLVSVTGGLHPLLPRHGTPITVLVAQGEVATIISGRLSPEHMSGLWRTMTGHGTDSEVDEL